MAYLSDDELLDTEGGFTGWDDGTGAGAEETLEQALAEERLAELENELEQDEHPIDYEAELENEEEEAAPVSEKRLKRELRAEAIRRLEEAARTEKDFRAVVKEWNKLDRNRERRERDHENLRGDVPLEYQAVPEPKLIPRWMNNPAYRQLMAGNFLDILFDCPYEMHNLTADAFISRIVVSIYRGGRDIPAIQGRVKRGLSLGFRKFLSTGNYSPGTGRRCGTDKKAVVEIGRDIHSIGIAAGAD